jgi:hypothetical protein
MAGRLLLFCCAQFWWQAGIFPLASAQIFLGQLECPVLLAAVARVFLRI